MQRVQRKFGTFLKRSEDEATVGNILAEFQTADKLLDSFTDSARSFQNAWKDVLSRETLIAKEMELLYRSINDPETKIETTCTTPQAYLDKTRDYRAAYVDLQADLQQETEWIQTKLLQPAMDAKSSMAPLKKTIKKRENCKLDFERYQSRVEHARSKAKTPKDEFAVAKQEAELAQSIQAYTDADNNIKRTMPPVIDAVMKLVPLLLANQVMLQHALVGQLYTVLSGFCQSHGLSATAPPMEQVVATWNREFTPMREEVEGSFKTLIGGRAIHQPMTLPTEDKSKVLGIRNRVGLGRRTSSQGVLPQAATVDSREVAVVEDDFDEQPPQKPSRPGNGPVPMGNKLRIASYSSLRGQDSLPEDEESPPIKPPRPSPGSTPVPYANKGRTASNASLGSFARTPLTPGAPGTPMGTAVASSGLVIPGRERFTPGSESRRGSAAESRRDSTASTPYLTPMDSNQGLSLSGDYFTAHRNPSSTSLASSIASKKKPPPPIPVKRLPSQQIQYVTALYDFGGQGDGDLSFAEGDRIKIVKKSESLDDWWLGELKGVTGSFPANYVQV